jgi:hypothetical protein
MPAFSVLAETAKKLFLKEVVFQVETLAHLEGVRSIGAFLWNVADCTYERLGSAPETLLPGLHVLGLRRELARKSRRSQSSGCWHGNLSRPCRSTKKQSRQWRNNFTIKLQLK